jgi:putative membrane protein
VLVPVKRLNEGILEMFRLLLRWILHAIALLLVAWLVPGFHVRSLASALVAAVVIGLLNATLGLLLKIITLPLGILTLGIFFLVINAFILRLASGVVPGFYVTTFGAAFIGAAVLALLHMVFESIAD